MNIEEDIIHRLKSFIKELKQDTTTVFRITAESREVLANDIENILADRERLEKENKKNKDALELLNKMKKKYKLALFMIIRNSVVMPKGIELQKSSKEISQMSYEALCEVLNMIDFNTAEKMYKEGKEK